MNSAGANMLPIIQSLWVGDPLSNLEKLCIQSFLDNGHEFHLYVYDDVHGIPDGAKIKDGNEILPASDIFFTRKKYIAPFSDWFRYALLYKRGGFWVDMDTVCIKPFDFKEEIVFGCAQSSRHAIGVIKFPKNHFLMQKMEYASRHHTEIQPWDDKTDKQRKKKQHLLNSGKERISYQSLGNHSWDKAVRYYELEKYSKPYMYFYMSNNANISSWYDNSFKDGVDLCATTHSLHISNKILGGVSGFDKNANFSKHSAFEQLKRKHGIAPIKDTPIISHQQTRMLFSERERKSENRKLLAIRKYKKRVFIFTAIGSLLGFLVGLVA